MESQKKLDAIIVGAGFGGLAMLKKLRDAGFNVLLLETGTGPGGVWFWNRYPGARCDVESIQYSYQFSEELQQSWTWKELYAPQEEIRSYLNHVVERFDLARDIRFSSRVVAADYRESTDSWVIRTERDNLCYEARFCILATGPLSAASTPNLSGLASFQGSVYHTGTWPPEGVSFEDQRVAVIGTGSSGVQAIPLIAAKAKHLYVFQRSAAYVVPARNRLLTADECAEVKLSYSKLRAHWWSLPSATGLTAGDKSALQVTEAEREALFESQWLRGGLSFQRTFSDLSTSEAASRTAMTFFATKIREAVTNPQVAERLIPKDLFGIRRLCLGTNYYETYNRDNVTLVDLRSEPLKEITLDAVRTSEESYPVDVIVFATGYDAMTGSFLRVNVRGRQGRTLEEAWQAGPQTYLGLATSGFPNLFFMGGPGSPSVLANVVTALEQQATWITQCLVCLRAERFSSIEAQMHAQDQWVAHVNEVSAPMLINRGNSWYLGANIPGKPRVFMPYVGFPKYVAHCDAVAGGNYRGFTLSRESTP